MVDEAAFGFQAVVLSVYLFERENAGWVGWTYEPERKRKIML